MQNDHNPAPLLWKRLDWGWLTVVLLALPLMLPFLQSGATASADAQVNVYRTVSAAVNFEAGHPFPRWSPFLHHGFGYPIHNFYAPGVHMLGAGLMLGTGIDAADAYKLLQAAFVLLAALGAYAFARTFASRPAALAAVAVFTFAPWRFDTLWALGNVPQMAAMGCLPWLFWALHRTVTRPRLRWAAASALIYGGITLLHHASGFLIAPFAGLYALLLAYIQPTQRFWRVVWAAGGLVGGLLVSMVFWLPALAEFRYVSINRVQEGIFSFTANFVPLQSLLGTPAPVDRAQLNHPRFFAVGTVAVCAAVGAAVLALWRVRRLETRVLHGLVGGAFTALTVFLMTPGSTVVWETVPVASLVVYPWRLLGITSFAGSMAAAALVMLLPRWRIPAAAVLIVAAFAASLPMLYAPLDRYQPNRSTPAEAVRYERSSGNLGTTSANEYLPIGAQTPPLSPQTEVDEALVWRVYPYRLPGASATASPLPDCPNGSACYRVESPVAHAFTFQQMYFVGWRAEVNGQAVEPSASGELGLLTVPMPAGAHTVRVWYGGTTIQHLAASVSALAAVICGVMLVWPRRAVPSLSVYPHPPTRPERRFALGVVTVMAIFLLLDSLWLTPSTEWLRPRSPLEATPIQTPVNAVFGDTLELLGYTLETPEVRAGETVVVRLHWRLVKPTDRRLRAIVRVVSPDQSAMWGSGGTSDIADIATSRWPLDRYAVDAYAIGISGDAQPFIGMLRVGVYDVTDNQVWPLDALPLPDGALDMPLAPVRVLGDYRVFDESALQGQPVTFGEVIRLEGWRVYRAQDGQTCVELRWHPLTDSRPDLSVMLHPRDLARTFEEVFDSPPFAGAYLTPDWVRGQTLDDRHCFPASERAEVLDVALYTRTDGVRLRAVQAGAALPDDLLSVPLLPTR
jgi:hypothetical protein